MAIGMILVSSDQDSHDDKGQLENCSNPVLPWCQTAKRLLFLPSKVVEYVRRLHISNHPAILNSQQPYSLPAPHHNLSTPRFFQTKTVVTASLVTARTNNQNVVIMLILVTNQQSCSWSSMSCHTQ